MITVKTNIIFRLNYLANQKALFTTGSPLFYWHLSRLFLIGISNGDNLNPPVLSKKMIKELGNNAFRLNNLTNLDKPTNFYTPVG